MLLRIRATSFLSGFGLAAGIAIFKLRQDLLDSQEVLLDQASKLNAKELEQRVAQLEARVQEKK